MVLNLDRLYERLQLNTDLLRFSVHVSRLRKMLHQNFISFREIKKLFNNNVLREEFVKASQSCHMMGGESIIMISRLFCALFIS